MMTGTSLLDRAVRVLAAGPAHTHQLAGSVLDLRGNPGAAAKAVFTLLGQDPRFSVDASGVWSLAPGAAAPGPALSRLSFAVVDVETTGGGRGDRITEVAIVHVDHGVVGACFQTLVNPGRPIPPRIQAFTGITDRMVAAAPPFEAIADEVSQRLRGRVFVAHNERFDRRFLTSDLLDAATDFPEVECLCTVRLGRRLLPALRRYNLDALAAHFRIPIEGRHRAYGDALATARLLLQLLREAEARGIRELSALVQGAGTRGPRAGAR